MSGRWVEAWDETSGKWTRLYIEEPVSAYAGTAYVISEATPERPLILDAHGKPIKRPPLNDRRAGFRR